MVRPVDVMIAGSQKAGTSSLLRLVSQHPRVHTHDSGEFGYFIQDALYELGYEASYKSCFQKGAAGSLVVAKNVGVFESQTALNRVIEHNSDMKVVISLRDPVDRAYSAFWYMKSIGAETAEDFRAVVDLRSSERFSGNEFLVRNCDYVGKGYYHRHLKALLSIIPTAQVHILDFVSLKNSPIKTCNELFEFLDLSPFTVKPKVENRSTRIKYPWLASPFGGHRRGPIKRRVAQALPSEVRLRFKKLIWRMNSSDEPIPEMDYDLRCDLYERFSDDNLLLLRDFGISFQKP